LLDKEFIRQSFILQFGDGLRRGLIFFQSIILVRILQPEFYGQFILILALGTLLPLLLDFGLRKTLLLQLTQSFINNDKKESQEAIATAAKISILFSILILFIGAGILPMVGRVIYGEATLGWWAWALCWVNLFLIPLNIYLGVLESLRRFKDIVFFETLFEMTKLIFLCAPLILGFHLQGAFSLSDVSG